MIYRKLPLINGEANNLAHKLKLMLQSMYILLAGALIEWNQATHNNNIAAAV